MHVAIYYTHVCNVIKSRHQAHSYHILFYQIQLYIYCSTCVGRNFIYLAIRTLLIPLVSQVEQIVYSTESSLEEENEAIVRQVVATHNKCLQTGSINGELRKFRSMPHVMRSFFQSGSSSSCRNSGSCDGNDGKPSAMPTISH